MRDKSSKGGYIERQKQEAGLGRRDINESGPAFEGSVKGGYVILLEI